MRPTSRDQIRIAIICRLEVEATAIEAIFDERYSLPYRLQKKGRIIENSYTTGRIRSRHVVLSLMHEGIYDTITARGLKAQFPNIVVALLVGVGGGTPYASDNTEIILGDVIISDRIIIEGITIRQALSHSSLKVGVHESAINLRGQKNLLQKRTTEYLEDLGIRKEWKYPGVLRDALFDASYRHIHHSQELNTGAICSICNFDHGNNVCEAALLSDCQQIGCTGKLVRRRRLDTDSPGVSVHIGDVFSHRMMIRCASNRDKVIKAEGAIAFEELGADVLEILPCFIIKGVCDYADGHKDGIWQKYAAAAAASCTKAFLEVYPKFFEGVRSLAYSTKMQISTVPFERNPSFVGRKNVLANIKGVFQEGYRSGHRRAALVGVGGTGKTEIAIEYSYQARVSSPNLWIFWISAGTAAAFEESYRVIATRANISGFHDIPKINIFQLVFEWLCDPANGPWLIILDDADDHNVLLIHQSSLRRTRVFLW